MDTIGSRHTFASYFALAVDTILKVLWREGYARGQWELVRLTWNRIRRLEGRFNRLVALWRAGTLPAAGTEVRKDTPTPALPRLAGLGREADQRANGADRASARAAWPFPRGRAWVVRVLAPVTGQQCVGTLCLAWEEPEMRALFDAAPQVGRILRPLAHMLGAPLPEWLQLPKRARKSTSPRLVRFTAQSPQSGEGVWARRDARSELIVPNRRLPAQEQAEDAVRRSEASGKAIDLRKFSAEAYGWFVHPPRDANCPPPKIGYAGRRRRPPKDYVPPRDE